MWSYYFCYRYKSKRNKKLLNDNKIIELSNIYDGIFNYGSHFCGYTILISYLFNYINNKKLKKKNFNYYIKNKKRDFIKKIIYQFEYYIFNTFINNYKMDTFKNYNVNIRIILIILFIIIIILCLKLLIQFIKKCL